MAEPFLGEIRMFGFNYNPRGWAFCDGQLLPIAQNSALFSLLGTIYGGDGRTTFALPDLRSRVPVHEGQGPGLSNYRLGSKGGAESNTLTVSELPSHGHTGPALPVNDNDPNVGTPGGHYLSKSDIYNTGSGSNQYYGAGHLGDTGLTGGGQAFNIRQPYQTVNFCIALQGIFPPRD